MLKRFSHRFGRIDFELNCRFDVLDRISKDKPGSLDRAEEIRNHGELATANIREINCRPIRSVNSSLDFGCFQVCVDFVFDPNQVTLFGKVINAVFQCSVTHGSKKPLVERVLRDNRKSTGK